MAVHPVAAWDFDALARALSERRASGLVRATVAPDNPALTLYCYTPCAVVERAWDGVVDLARGLVLDHDARCVRAQPFPKFFNYGERSATLPDEPFRTYEKVDGSLGIVFHDGTRWRVCTKGGWTSPQALWAEAWLHDHADTGAFIVGDTYLAEIVYGANRIVVRYPYEGLVLLGAYAETGAEYAREGVVDLGRRAHLRVVDAHDYASVEAMRADLADFASDREGFVVHFPASGYRVKLKGAEYLRIHRLVSRVTPLGVWDVLANGGSLDAVRRDIPEEFWRDFDAIRALLDASLASIVATVNEWHAQYADRSDKDVGLALPTMPEVARTFLFARRKGGEAWLAHPKTRLSLCKVFRPTNNVLAGYHPSEAMARVAEEE